MMSCISEPLLSPQVLNRANSMVPHARAEAPKRITHHHDDDDSEEESDEKSS